MKDIDKLGIMFAAGMIMFFGGILVGRVDKYDYLKEHIDSSYSAAMESMNKTISSLDNGFFTQEALETYPAENYEEYDEEGCRGLSKEYDCNRVRGTFLGENKSAEKVCKGLIFIDTGECLDDATLGTGTRICKGTIDTTVAGSIIEEVNKKCPLVEKPLEYPLESVEYLKFYYSEGLYHIEHKDENGEKKMTILSEYQSDKLYQLLKPLYE